MLVRVEPNPTSENPTQGSRRLDQFFHVCNLREGFEMYQDDLVALMRDRCRVPALGPLWAQEDAHLLASGALACGVYSRIWLVDVADAVIHKISGSAVWQK